MEILKVKASALQESNLKAVEGLYNPKVEFLAEKVNTLEEQIEKLHAILSKQIDKNSELIRKIRIKESKHQEDLKKMKNLYDNQEDFMKQKFFTEKSLIMQQSAQVIKNYEMKATNAKFTETQLGKLRKQLDDRINENEVKDKAFEEERKIWEQERLQLINNNRKNEEHF